MKIIGANQDSFSGTKTVFNDDLDEYVEENALLDRYSLYLLKEDGSVICMVLYHTEGMCFSGRTSANFGNIEFVYFENIEQLNDSFEYNIAYLPKKDLPIENFILEDELFERLQNFNVSLYSDECNPCEQIKQPTFSFSVFGRDNYYPDGYAYVNMELFELV